MSQRLATYDADGGRCCGCRRRLSRTAGVWSWHAHHVVKQQTLRRRGVRPARIRDATFTILLCRRCHERHESVTERVPLDRIRPEVVALVDALGPWAQDLLRRYHPSSR